jgi:hypothetical protein
VQRHKARSDEHEWRDRVPERSDVECESGRDRRELGRAVAASGDAALAADLCPYRLQLVLAATGNDGKAVKTKQLKTTSGPCRRLTLFNSE